jgi:hypothetical protein
MHKHNSIQDKLGSLRVLGFDPWKLEQLRVHKTPKTKHFRVTLHKPLSRSLIVIPHYLVTLRPRTSFTDSTPHVLSHLTASAHLSLWSIDIPLVRESRPTIEVVEIANLNNVIRLELFYEGDDPTSTV